MGQSVEKTVGLGVRGVAEDIGLTLNRLDSEPSYSFICVNISRANIRVNQSFLTVEKAGKKYTIVVPENTEAKNLEDATSFCAVKSGNTIKIYKERPICNNNFICEPDECKTGCNDCFGPKQICVGDEFCNPTIGENCVNSQDCACNNTCCPDDPASDEIGCTDSAGIGKGQQCWCDNQCEAGLKCNPTHPLFTNYSKACCEPGKVWNGNECVVSICKYPCVEGCIIPEKFDWRDYEGKNWLSPVRNQGSCGSCWAFSAVGSVEGTYNIEQNTPGVNTDLSEQDLVSCGFPLGSLSGGAGGCRGGFSSDALKYIRDEKIVSEDCFPYRAADVSCNRCSSYTSKQWTIDNYRHVMGTDNIKRAIICEGPVSASVRPWPGGRMGHAIVLVGYDDTMSNCMIGKNGNGCWILKNSWGVSKGDHGYYTIGYGTNKIENWVYSPVGVRSP